MKKFLFSTIVFLVFPSVAQETAVVVSTEANNPEMPALFFTKEQRRVLEAVRRGVVQKEDLEIDSGNFVPVVLLEETLADVDDRQQINRKNEIQINALIRNRTTGKSRVWLNGEQVEIDGDNDLLRADGLVVNSQGVNSAAISGNDEFSNSRFEAKVGQIINIDGKIDESLPVILRHQ